MDNKVWAVITESKCDGDDEFDSFFSLFRNYDDALAEFQDRIEEEIEIMGGDENENAWTDESDEADGAKWWSIEFSDCWRFSKVYLRAMEVA